MGKTKQGEEKCILTLEIKTKYATHRPAATGIAKGSFIGEVEGQSRIILAVTEEMDGGWRMDGEER